MHRTLGFRRVLLAATGSMVILVSLTGFAPPIHQRTPTILATSGGSPSLSLDGGELAGVQSQQVPVRVAAAQAPTDSVLLLHLDEPVGSTVFSDSSGNNHSGACSAGSCPAAGVAAPWGTAIRSDGIDDYVVVPAGAVNIADSSFTVAFWANRTNEIGADTALGQGDGIPNHGLHLAFDETRGFVCGFFANDLDAPGYVSTGWHHWACSFDVATRERRTFRDGTLIAQDIAPAPYQGSGPLYVGRGSWGGKFRGDIDELQVFSRVLSLSEIGALATFNVPPDAPSNPVPVNGAAGVPLTQTLSWDGGDPDSALVTYTIAFGKNNPPTEVGVSLNTPTYVPSMLGIQDNYYWAVSATDGMFTTTGTIWTFRTLDGFHAYLPVAIRPGTLVRLGDSPLPRD